MPFTVIIVILLFFARCDKSNYSDEIPSQIVDKSQEQEETSIIQEIIEDEKVASMFDSQKNEKATVLKIQIGNEILYADLENNSSSDALVEKLRENPVTINMEDYANFEKVGKLPWSLPRNDTYVKTQPGDIILYLGSHIVIYYDTNSYNLTKIGKIRNVDHKLKDFLGSGNVTITFSVE